MPIFKIGGILSGLLDSQNTVAMFPVLFVTGGILTVLIATYFWVFELWGLRWKD